MDEQSKNGPVLGTTGLQVNDTAILSLVLPTAKSGSPLMFGSIAM
jgi:hypothetical protein